MIKLVYCITPKPGLTQADFSHYWRTVHGPIGARIPHLKKLVQSHVVRNPLDSLQPDFHGMAELWFESWEDLISARKSPEWQAATEDEANFVDPTRTAYFVSEEKEIELANE